MTEPMTNEQHQPPRLHWFWRLLGLRRRDHRRLTVVPSLWGWILIVGIGIGIATTAFMEYSMQPDFCRSCHLMEPYYQAWHDSTHRSIPCGDCHFEPGWRNTIKGKFEASSQAVKFITGTYGSKPHAEVRDSSCLRSGCHEQRLLEGRVNWTIPTEGNREVTIRFDHKPHLEEIRRGKELRCVSCHSQMVQGQHIVVTLDTCYLCHFKDLKHGREEETIGGCKGCHDAPKDEIRLATGIFNHAEYLERGVGCENCHSDSVKGNGEVPRQMCWTCHNQPQQIARYSDTAFVHRTHISKHKVECSSCHVQIEHRLTAATPPPKGPLGLSHMLDNAGTCGQCHEQTHIGPLDLYRGTGARGVPTMPSPMHRAQVDCIACHQTKSHSGETALVTGQTFVATQERCDYCHGNRYQGVLENWRTIIADHTQRAEVALEEARTAIEQRQLTAPQRLTARRLLDDAAHNIRLVKLGHGVHNVTYATAALNLAIDNCRRVVAGELETVALSRDGP